MLKEQWKDISNYIGIYQVSNLGRVKSLSNGKTKKEKIKHFSINKQGYKQVILSNHGKDKLFRVNRLVAQAFIPNPNNLPQVNHKDENKGNNCVDNLEWCSAKYNCNYGIRNSKIRKKIIQLSLNGDFIKEWDSAYQVEKELHIDNSRISKCCKHQRYVKSVGGYKWEYKKISF